MNRRRRRRRLSIKARPLRIIVGTKAGDVYDLYPRLLAEFMPKYIPGNPNIIIQNVAGAASLIAANQVYNIAKPDGLTLGAIYPALYLDQLVKRPEVKYDWNKFGWIGSPVGSNHMMYMRADTPYKTIDDVRAAASRQNAAPAASRRPAITFPSSWKKPSAPNSTSSPAIKAGQDIDLAVERGEVVCRSFTITDLSFPRAFFYLAQEKLRARALSNRQQARRAPQRCADDLRD